MKINNKPLHTYSILFVLGFGSSLGTFWHENAMTLLQKVGFALVIGPLMIPFGLVIAVPLAWMFGIKRPGNQDVGPKDENRK